jgi:hypothetical protein
MQQLNGKKPYINVQTVEGERERERAVRDNERE